MLKPKRFLVAAISAAGVSVLVQALAFVRQLLIAAYFGVSRDLDIYLIAYSIAAMVVFTFSTAFDFAVVPRLVRIQKYGDAAARSLAVSLFRWSFVFGAAATVLLIVLTPLLTPLMATGFDPAHKAALSDLMWDFSLWTSLCVPYYAAAARHKARRDFNRVFGAEILIGGVSILLLVFFHGDIRFLPWAYAGGYAVALLSILPGTGIIPHLVERSTPETASTLRNVGELYFANQTGSIGAVIDRHFQSLVPPGGIAGMNYTAQIVSGLVGLLTFREIYVVPLAEIDRRDEKLERLIIGLLALAIPISGFVAIMAHEIIEFLFQRGRFDATATHLTASILQIGVFALIPSAVGNPLFRMLQIVDRVSLIHVIYLSNVMFLGVFGYLFVAVLGWGVQGLAWMLLMNGIGSFIVNSMLVSRCGVTLRWSRVGRYTVFIIASSILASLAASAIAPWIAVTWVRLSGAGVVYGAVILAMYLPLRTRFSAIAG